MRKKGLQGPRTGTAKQEKEVAWPRGPCGFGGECRQRESGGGRLGGRPLQRYLDPPLKGPIMEVPGTP